MFPLRVHMVGGEPAREFLRGEGAEVVEASVLSRTERPIKLCARHLHAVPVVEVTFVNPGTGARNNELSIPSFEKRCAQRHVLGPSDRAIRARVIVNGFRKADDSFASQLEAASERQF